ncbi:uncharacterized protein CCR75_000663 [Bremia lactucae]|uniref:DUF3752 domain-containing protein n=1 Tax=Bremia lactucae TaxID=4779 RepID=A0A976FE61_BRELC|nr:hypothetical protein CCR75_000663 [Bremia lactucae]
MAENKRLKRQNDDDTIKRKRHKRNCNDFKKKRHKQHKQHKYNTQKIHRRHRESAHGSENDGENEYAPVPDFIRARKVLCELLTETPELVNDLLTLMQMLDDGEIAVIGGIKNRRIRHKLKDLFPLLGLIKLKEPKGAFAKKKNEEEPSLMNVLKHMLTADSDKLGAKEYENTKLKPAKAEDTSTIHRPIKRDLPIGPALPSVLVRISNTGVQSDDEEDFMGPALPGMKGFRAADESTELKMAQQANLLETEQWKLARAGDRGLAVKEAGNTPMRREAWMTMMFENSTLQDALGPQSKLLTGKSVAFRSKDPAAVDKTWFDLPEERERANRAKLDMELLGYVRQENASSDSAARSIGTSATAQSIVNESILPVANPKQDEEMRKQMEQLLKSRGPSLLEQHQRKQAEQAKLEAGRSQIINGWNRERDLTARRGMSQDDAERMISAAKQINSKFTAPTISRQFL